MLEKRKFGAQCFWVCCLAPCILYRQRTWARRAVVAVLIYRIAAWCLADGCSLHGFFRSLVVFFGPRRGVNTTSGTRSLGFALIIGSAAERKASSLKRSWAELLCHAASHLTSCANRAGSMPSPFRGHPDASAARGAERWAAWREGTRAHGESLALNGCSGLFFRVEYVRSRSAEVYWLCR